jgi:hypothetical protein
MMQGRQGTCANPLPAQSQARGSAACILHPSPACMFWGWQSPRNQRGMPPHACHAQGGKDGFLNGCALGMLQGVELLFYGDSITETWRGTDMGRQCSRCAGVPDVFAKYFGSKYAAEVLAVGGAPSCMPGRSLCLSCHSSIHEVLGICQYVGGCTGVDEPHAVLQGTRPRTCSGAWSMGSCTGGPSRASSWS